MAATEFGETASSLRRALEQGPSLWGMSTGHRRRLATCVQAALSSRFARGDAVYHGPFSGLLLRGVAHLLKVRITASLEARAAEAARQGLTPAKSMRHVRATDRADEQIAQELFGLEDSDEDYDMVVDLSEVDQAEVIRSVVDAAGSAAYRPTAFSRHQLRDYEAADQLAAGLACELGIDVQVRVHQGVTQVRAQAPERARKKIQACAEVRAAKIEGIRKLEVEVVDSWLHPLPASHR
jgi:hypothetical protein